MLDLINTKENLYGDHIAKVRQYDFSRANSSDEARTLAITSIATVCTQKFESIGSEKLCTKLLTEAHGIPSSAYGFVPVLLTEDKYYEILHKISGTVNIYKFGEWILTKGNVQYLLTNLRALVNDIGLEASKEFYNTDENEIAIIKKHFKVFKHKMDIRSARQFMRHGTGVWQELSRRYVTALKLAFEFYISDKWIKKGLKEERLKRCEQGVELYFKAIEKGIAPQDARDCLELCTYTEIWSGWQPFALENMLTERTAIGTQWELRQTALAIKELIGEEK